MEKSTYTPFELTSSLHCFPKLSIEATLHSIHPNYQKINVIPNYSWCFFTFLFFSIWKKVFYIFFKTKIGHYNFSIIFQDIITIESYKLNDSPKKGTYTFGFWTSSAIHAEGTGKYCIPSPLLLKPIPTPRLRMVKKGLKPRSITEPAANTISQALLHFFNLC